MPLPGMPPQPLQAIQSPYAAPAPPGQPGQPPPQAPPLDQETIESLLSLSGPRNAAELAALRAAALRQQTPGVSAQGNGPLGIRQGEGRGGGLVSIGDLVAGLAGQHELKKVQAEQNQATGLYQAAQKKAYEAYLKQRQAGAPVAQGTPLTSMSLPDPDKGPGPLSI